MLLKAASFLTSLVKSKNATAYIKEGFTVEDLKNETLSVLKEGTELPSSKIQEFQTQIEKEIPLVIECLLEEELVVEHLDKFHIDNKSLDLANFMLDLSSLMVEMEGSFKNEKMPFRNYPGSSDVYGLN